MAAACSLRQRPRSGRRLRAVAVSAGRPLHDVQLVELPGKGRGLVAVRNLQPGDLVLSCRPLALVQAAVATSALTGRPVAQARSASSPSPPQRPAGSAAAASAAAAAAAPKGAASGGACSEAALVAELQRLTWGPRQTRLLTSMYRGVSDAKPAGSSARPTAATYAATGAPGITASPNLDLKDLADPWGTAQAAAAPAGPSAAGGAASGLESQTSAPPLTPEELAAVVRLNATGLPSDDVLLGKLYGITNMSYIGLWPAHAMINHSCAPNAVAVVSGGLLCVRCVAPVPAGSELSISYAGALGLGPLLLRRALLERNHRFRCTCARCHAEELVPRELAQLWADIVMLVSQQLQPRLAPAAAALSRAGAQRPTPGAPAPSAAATAAAAAAVLPALLDVRGQLAKCCGLFEETLGQLAPPPQEALWLQASMYPLFETRARCAQLLAQAAQQASTAAPAPPLAAPGAAPAADAAGAAAAAAGGAPPDQAAAVGLSLEYLEALSLCLRLQGVANAGSDAHVQLAARYDAACAAHAARYPGPRSSELAADARRRLERVLSARYGTAAAAGPSATGATAAAASGAAEPAVTGPQAPSMAELLTVLGQVQQVHGVVA
ncbi:hypothetical protein HYH03_003585 [Edaphochlamys debaryana]|uniref:SET domain-containing protein n=1 Tax=Edaphochlamys debaryana TaxID=47281 RepID=A0A836C321_9CHLO|nr:hypothetical protein HYH03_003585 [Edaphochlamys debaryana]|eukprot:KAG2498325.1 hypothetical protein HYH03_003585 [Edaphochlamys debaryana]